MNSKLIKQAKHLLLSGIMMSVGLWAMPAKAEVSDSQLNSFVEALRKAAPPQSPNDGMYSAWQVLPGIIPSWTKQCTGQEMTPAQFEANPEAARSVVSCIMRRELNKQMQNTGNNPTAAVRRTACWWMTGDPSACNSGATADYVQRVVTFYQQ